MIGMKTTTRQDKDFLDRLFRTISSDYFMRAIRNVLDQDTSWVLDWVTETFNVDEVFDETELNTWAEDNGYIKKV